MKKWNRVVAYLVISGCALISADAEQVAYWSFGIPHGGSYGDAIMESTDSVSSLVARAANLSSSSAKVFYAAPNPDLSGASADIRGGGFLKVVDNQLLTGHNNGESGFSALTIDAYVFLRTLPRTRAVPGVIVRKTGAGTNNRPGYQFYVSFDGRLNFTLADGATFSTQGTASSPEGSIQAGQWVHVTGTWDGSAIRIYIDGVESGSKLYSATSGIPGVLDADTIGDFCIGGWQSLSGTYAQQMNGLVDDVTIYNEALLEPPSKKLSLTGFDAN